MRYAARTAGAFLSLFLAACTTVHPATGGEDQVAVPDGLAEELRRSVEHLAIDIGERNCYRAAKLDDAADWIESQFKSMGYAMRRLPVGVPAGLPYGCGARTVWNVEAEKPGSDLANEIVVIGAHYDSKVAMANWHDDGPPLPKNPGTPGADDNASGVAGVLAVARILKEYSFRRTIKFVAFVNEEPPFFQSDAMGSLVYARNLTGAHSRSQARPRKIIGMISFEMLGYYAKSEQRKRPFGVGITGLTSETNYVAFLSDWRSGDFAEMCCVAFSHHSRVSARVSRVPLVADCLAWSDDWSFWQIGVPAFSVTDTAFLRNDHYHDVSDTPTTLDFAKMADVVWGLRDVVETLGVEDVEARPCGSGRR